MALSRPASAGGPHPCAGDVCGSKQPVCHASRDQLYPHVVRWVQDFGWIEIGQDDFSRRGAHDSMVRVLDIGGLIWEGKASYATLDAALHDLDQALAAWFKAEMRE